MAPTGPSLPADLALADGHAPALADGAPQEKLFRNFSAMRGLRVSDFSAIPISWTIPCRTFSTARTFPSGAKYQLFSPILNDRLSRSTRRAALTVAPGRTPRSE